MTNTLHDLALATGSDDDRLLAAAMLALGDRIAGRPLRTAAQYGQAIRELALSGHLYRMFPAATLIAAGWLDENTTP